MQEFETLNLEIKELKASIETSRAQIQAAEEAIVQLTEQGGKLNEQVAEAKVNNQSSSSLSMSVDGVISLNVVLSFSSHSFWGYLMMLLEL
jgi:chorismate mutase